MDDNSQVQVVPQSTDAEKAQAAKQMSAARALLMAKSPFISTLALSMHLKPSDSIPTAATNGRTIWYNPKFVLKLDRDRQVFLLAHEAMHPAFDHVNPGRRAGRDQFKWNMAGDYVINQILTDAGFTMIEGGLLHAGYKDMSTEHVYSMIPDQPNGGGIGGTGNDLAEPDDPQEAQQIAAEVKQRVAQAAQVARANKEYGTLPGQLKRMIDELLNPRIDWRQLLRRFFSERAKDDYSWRRPSRRFTDAFMPSMYSEHMGHLALVIDTSGSIGEEQFKQFVSEVEAIRQEVRPVRTTIMCCDTIVHNPQEFDQQDSILSYQPAGFGGTNLPVAFDWIEQNLDEPPQACLIFTDMYTPFGEDPGYPTLWVSYGNPDAVAPFGETISMD